MANMIVLDNDRIDLRNLPFGGTLGSPRLIAWPVVAYRVTMPLPDSHRDCENPIHRLITKLVLTDWIPEQSRDGDLVVEKTTGLPWDIVRCTLSRLQDRGIIDEYCRLTNSGKSQLKPDMAEQEEENDRICTALVFREKIGGCVLPYVQELTNEKPLRKHTKASNEILKKLVDNGEFSNAKITVQEVLGAYRRWRKLAQAYNEDEVKFPSAQQIRVVGEAEDFYLKCPMAILSRDGDFAIADPFGYGMSSLLETTLRKWIITGTEHANKHLRHIRLARVLAGASRVCGTFPPSFALRRIPLRRVGDVSRELRESVNVRA